MNCPLLLNFSKYGFSLHSRVFQRLGAINRFASDDVRNKKIVQSKDGKMLLCWHPEEPFPYEYSRPLPRLEAEVTEGDSVIKAQYSALEKNRFQLDGPTQEELMKIFHTTRHAFDRRPSLKYKKKNPPKDREGI